MAEIRNGEFVRNETNQNSFGGTERMTERLAKEIDKNLLSEFQIVSSRVRELQGDKIRIFWCHDLAKDPESEFLRDKNEQNKFHKFVFVSNWQMQNYIQEYDLPWSKCVVLQNAIDIFETHEKPKNEIRLIYTPTPHRGLNILLPVFDKLCEKHDNIHLDVFSSFELYGWQSRDEHYKELFNFANTHEKITYHGTQPNEVVRKALMQSHIFAYPSTWQETSCLCLIEAMSAGLACVHSNYGALYETSNNWTYMYQYNEDLNTHARTFYGVLDAVIENVASGELTNRLETAMHYTNAFYSWERRRVEWENLLKVLRATVSNRSIPSEEFVYTT